MAQCNQLTPLPVCLSKVNAVVHETPPENHSCICSLWLLQILAGFMWCAWWK